MEARELERVRPVEQPAPQRRGVTFRAVLIGFLIMPFNSYWIVQTETVRYASFPTTVSLFYNVIFILLILVAVNHLIRRFWPAKALSQGELCVIYIILCLSSTLPSHDGFQVLAPIIAHPFRYANPVNQWQELFMKYLPSWLFVSDEQALRGMYEGNSSIWLPENFRPWLVPVISWSAFASALYLVTLSMTAIFRRRWIESEKLTYPIIQLPLEMASPRTQVFSNRLLWLAFGIVFAIDFLNGLHVLYPSVPQIPVKATAIPQFNLAQQLVERPWNAVGRLMIGFYPFIIGIGLLLPKDLVFSCWFFFFQWKAQRVLAAYLGWTHLRGFPYVNEQTFGGYVGLALFCLWTSRHYLRRVLRTAIGTARELEDSEEPMSYRAALFYIVLGFVFLVGFSWRAGMAVAFALAFFLIHFTIALSVTRIRAEMGLPAHDMHYIGPTNMLPLVLGTKNISPRTLTINEIYFWFNRAYRSYAMPHQAEAFKLAERSGIANRPLAAVMFFSITGGTIVAFWALLQCYYNYGVSAKMSWVANYFGFETCNRLAGKLNNPLPASRGTVAAVILGFLFTLGLMTVKMRYVWWPLHPVGYAVSASWAMDHMWCALLVAWAIKATLTRYGGAPAYRRLVPFAFGLILGDLVCGNLWTIYGIIRSVPTYSIWQ